MDENVIFTKNEPTPKPVTDQPQPVSTQPTSPAPTSSSQPSGQASPLPSIGEIQPSTGGITSLDKGRSIPCNVGVHELWKRKISGPLPLLI